MTMTLNKAGAFAALFEALAYLTGFAVVMTLLPADGMGKLDPVQKLAFLLDHQAILVALHLVIYVAFGIALVVLAIALHARLQERARSLMAVATSFGLIWAGMVIASGMVANVGLAAAERLYASDPAAASAFWVAVSGVQDGLGGGIEVVGGVWVILLSRAALQAGSLGRPVHWLGYAVGLAGVLTVIPPLKALGAVFGLGQIVWFAWIGVLLLRADGGHAVPTLR